MLTFRLKKEHVMRAHETVPTIRHDITSTHAITRSDVVNTRPTIPNTHCGILKSLEDARGQDQMVSTIRTLSVIERPLNAT